MTDIINLLRLAVRKWKFERQLKRAALTETGRQEWFRNHESEIIPITDAIDEIHSSRLVAKAEKLGIPVPETSWSHWRKTQAGKLVLLPFAMKEMRIALRKWNQEKLKWILQIIVVLSGIVGALVGLNSAIGFFQPNPKLSCEINQIGTQTNATPSPISTVLLIATVKNTGAPSMAGGYSAVITTAKGSAIQGRLTTVPDQQISYPNGFKRVLKLSEALYNKTITPIGHNSVAVGFLMFQFMKPEGAHDEGFWNSIKLSLTDINGKVSSCTSKPDGSGPNTVLTFPGLDDK